LCAIIEALLLYHSSGYSEAGANQALEKLSSAKVTGKEAFRLRFSLHLEINDLSSCAKLLSEIEADENNSRQLKTPPWLQLLILYQARCGNFSATEESIKILLDETQLQANYFLVVGSAQQQLAYRQFQQVCQSYTLNPYLTIGIEVKGLIDRQLLTLSRENFVKAFKFFKEASCNGETKNSLLIALSTGLELDLLDQDDLWQQLKILAPNTPLLLLEETLDIAEEKINDLQFLIARIEQLLVQPEGNPTFINQWCYLAIE